MRHFKLNSVLFSLMVMACVTFFMTSCAKEVATNTTPIVTEQERIEALEADPDFIRVSELNQELLVEIGKAMTAKNVSGEDFGNMCLNADNEALAALFAGTEVDNIMNEIASINENLIADYGDLYEVESDFDINSVDFASFDNVSVESRDCGIEYQVCMAAANFANAQCMSGLATPKWLCIAIYYAATKHCQNKYC